MVSAPTGMEYFYKLRHNSICISRKWNGFTDVMQTTESSDQSFKSVTKSCVWDRAIFSQVEVSIEGSWIESMVFDFCK